MTIADRLHDLVRRASTHEPARHTDPASPEASPPDRSGWATADLQALTSSEMELFTKNLRFDHADVRTSVLDELSVYHGISADEALRRCRDWEAISVQEWQVEDRHTGEGLLRFYRTMQSWSFDLLWYAYLQSEGYELPTSVTALRWLHRNTSGRRHLDFGSGCGATAQLFAESGWESTLGDVSCTLLDFSRFRLERRGQEVRYLDLTEQPLPVEGYDVITAIDTLAHVPDIAVTARQLHAALAPGGLLLANIDARPAAPENAWHLHDDEHSARYHLQNAGFLPVGHASIPIYRKVEPGTARHLIRSGRDWVALASPAARLAGPAARLAGHAARAVKTRLPR